MSSLFYCLLHNVCSFYEVTQINNPRQVNAFFFQYIYGFTDDKYRERERNCRTHRKRAIQEEVEDGAGTVETRGRADTSGFGNGHARIAIASSERTRPERA